MKRRTLLIMVMLAACLAAGGPLAVSHAQAKDGGSDDSGHGGGSNSGSGSSGSNSGSGSSGSGHGGGDDDHDDDDGGGGHGRGGRGSDYDRARDAVRDGQILPLKTVLQRIDAKRYGKVIDVNLKRSLFSDVYQLKVRDSAGAIRILRVDARNGSLLGGP